MRTNRWRSLFLVVALSVLVIPAFAKPIVKTINITSNQKIAGKELKSAEYRFIVDDTKLTIELKNKVVAEATGRWEPRDRKNDADVLVTGPDGQILELRFSGEKRVFVISTM